MPPHLHQAYKSQHFLNTLDTFLLHGRPFRHISGFKRFIIEFVYFGIKEARSCVFVGLFFLAIFLVPRAGLIGIPRYDLLLIIALAIQAAMLITHLETWDEAKTIAMFHVLGFALEVFKTSGSIQSWSYPDFAYTKLFGVPLFAGFMYAAVGSYIIQAWRLLDVRIRHHPPYWMSTAIALAIYANFFTHHYIGDFRWYIAACTLGLYARSTVIYVPYDHSALFHPHWNFHLACRKHQHDFRHMALSQSAIWLVYGAFGQMEFLVPAGHHVLCGRRTAKTYQKDHLYPGIAKSRMVSHPALTNPKVCASIMRLLQLLLQQQREPCQLRPSHQHRALRIR